MPIRSSLLSVATDLWVRVSFGLDVGIHVTASGETYLYTSGVVVARHFRPHTDDLLLQSLGEPGRSSQSRV